MSPVAILYLMNSMITILRFLRLPLVWTAVGDSLAGAAIAAALLRTADGAGGGAVEVQWMLWLATGTASAALYLAGMGLNDLVDIRRDRAAGSNRPLATGELTVFAAVGAVMFLAGAALMSAAFLPPAAQWMAIITAACIVIYNLAAKLWGPTTVLFMALCRVFNGMIGVAAIAGIGGTFRAPSEILEQLRRNCSAGDFATLAAWLGGLAIVTALASIISQWEKRCGRQRPLLAGRSADFWIINLLLGLSLVNAAAVGWAWRSAWGAAWGSAWGLAWLAAIPLVKLTAWAMRRAAKPSTTIS